MRQKSDKRHGVCKWVHISTYNKINSNVTIRINKGIAKSRAILHARVHTLSHSKVDSNVTIHSVENPCIAMWQGAYSSLVQVKLIRLSLYSSFNYSEHRYVRGCSAIGPRMLGCRRLITLSTGGPTILGHHSSVPANNDDAFAKLHLYFFTFLLSVIRTRRICLILNKYWIFNVRLS